MFPILFLVDLFIITVQGDALYRIPLRTLGCFCRVDVLNVFYVYVELQKQEKDSFMLHLLL